MVLLWDVYKIPLSDTGAAIYDIVADLRMRGHINCMDDKWLSWSRHINQLSTAPLWCIHSPLFTSMSLTAGICCVHSHLSSKKREYSPCGISPLTRSTHKHDLLSVVARRYAAKLSGCAN